MTLIKSKITRLSEPRWISRFLKPISKSMTTTFLDGDLIAIPIAKLAALVVFPTPPFPEVTAIIRPLVEDGSSFGNGSFL